MFGRLKYGKLSNGIKLFAGQSRNLRDTALIEWENELDLQIPMHKYVHPHPERQQQYAILFDALQVITLLIFHIINSVITDGWVKIHASMLPQRQHLVQTVSTVEDCHKYDVPMNSKILPWETDLSCK